MSKNIKLPSEIKNIKFISYPGYNSMIIQGKFGNKIFNFPSYFLISIVGDSLLISTKSVQNTNKEIQTNFGTLYSNLLSIITGISTGFTCKLSIVGVGYKIEIPEKDKIKITIGYTKPVSIQIPNNIKIKVINNTTIEGWSTSKQELTNFFNQVRLIKPASKDKYTNKGFEIS